MRHNDEWFEFGWRDGYTFLVVLIVGLVLTVDGIVESSTRDGFYGHVENRK